MSKDTTSRKLHILLAAVFGALVILFLLMSCAFQVRVTEAALVSTLNSVGTPITEPGLYGKAPWPFQRVYKFDKRSQLYEGGYREAITRNGSNLVVRMFVNWRIADPAAFYEKVGYQTAAGEKVLASLVEKYSGDVIGKHPLSDFVGTGEAQASLRQIEQEIQERIAADAESQGIAVSFAGFERLELPENVTKAVFDRMRAERERVTQQIYSEGERQAKRIRTEADEIALQKIKEAEAEASRIRGEGESKAYQAYKELRSDPEFALFLRKLEALEKTLSSKTTIILDKDIPPYDLLRERALRSLEQNSERPRRDD